MSSLLTCCSMAMIASCWLILAFPRCSMAIPTPLYTAPEQWLEQPRAASDQYALAITCYQLLSGHAPFTGNLYSIMHGHLQIPPPPLREFNPLIPSEVEAVILRALAKEPGDRYKDMR